MRVLNFYHTGVPEGAVYIGRAMPHIGLKGSRFANPFRLNDKESREETIERYRVWLWQQIRDGKITLKDLLDLEGKDLVCFCKQPKKEVSCHGDVIVNAVLWARSIKTDLSTEKENGDV